MMRPHLWFPLLAGLLGAVNILEAQQGIEPFPINDDPPPLARLRIGSTKLRETQRMLGIEFLPDGKHVVTTNGPLVHYWNLESGTMVNSHSFTPPKKGFRNESPAFRRFASNAISPDGKTFACLIGEHIYFAPFDLAKVPEYNQLTDGFGTKKQMDVGFVKVGNADGCAVLDEQGMITVFTKEKVSRFGIRVDSGIAKAKFFACAGTRVVVANEDGFVAILDLEKRKRVGQLAESIIWDVSMSPDGKTLAVRCNKDELVRWDMEKNETIARHKVDERIRRVALAPGGIRVLGYSAGTGVVELRDLKTDKTVFSDQIMGYIRPNLRFSSDGSRCLVYATDGSAVIHVWDAATGKTLTPAGFNGRITAMHLLPNGDLLATSHDTSIRLFDTKTGKEKDRYGEMARELKSWIFTRDSESVFFQTIGEGKIFVRDLASREERLLAEHFKEISYLRGFALSPDEKSIVYAEHEFPSLITLWLRPVNAGKATKLLSINRDYELLEDMTFASDNVLLMRFSNGVIRIIDLMKKDIAGRLALGYSPRPNVEPKIVLTPDRRFLGGAGHQKSENPGRDQTPQTIDFWEIDGGKRSKHFVIDKSPVTAYAMSRDGKTIVTGDYNGAVHVWDVATTNRILHQTDAHRGLVTAIAISANGRSFATGSTDTSILLWNMPDSTKK